MIGNQLLHYFSALNSAAKKFLRIKLTVASKFAFSSLSTEPLLAFPTKTISGLNMTLIRNCTNNATKSSGFFSESRIIGTLLPATTNWLNAFSTLFYLLLPSFTFNLPTNPRTCVQSKQSCIWSGCQWRNLPHDFPPCFIVHSFYRRARLNGLWDKILQYLVKLTRQRAGYAAMAVIAVLSFLRHTNISAYE